MRYFCCVFCGIPHKNYDDNYNVCGPGSSVGLATELRAGRSRNESRCGEIFRYPDRPWGPPSLLCKWYWVFRRGKMRLECAADHTAEVSKSRAIPTLWATPMHVKGLLYLYILVCVCVYIQYWFGMILNKTVSLDAVHHSCQYMYVCVCVCVCVCVYIYIYIYIYFGPYIQHFSPNFNNNRHEMSARNTVV